MELGGTVSLFGTAAPVEVDFRPLKQPGAQLALMALPQQGLHGMQLQPAASGDDSLRFTINSLPGRYVAKLCTTDSLRLTGFLLVAGQRLPLTLRPIGPNRHVPSRSQTLPASLPYQELATQFAGGAPGVRLDATLTIPSGADMVPGIVLVSGSGPHNRDGEQFAHQPFRVLADALARRGFAVLRYDERGVGRSTGNFAAATTADFAADAAAAVAALRAERRVKIGPVYVLGHSQGSLEVQRVAAQDPTVAGVVLLGGIGQPILTVYKERLRAQVAPRLAARDTAGRAAILSTRRVYEAVLDLIAASPDSAAAVAALQRPLVTQRISVEDMSYFASTYLEHTLQDILRQDPRPYLQKIKVPVLAVTGSRDEEAPASTQLPALATALQRGGNRAFTAVTIPNVTHFFQTVSPTTALSPYDNPETFSPAELTIIGDWLTHQVEQKRIPAAFRKK
jgi:pimeloyl-ACP methyl ester carboxylesterase